MLLRAPLRGRGYVAIGSPGDSSGIPITFDDPIFTSMTELTAPLTLSSGQSLTRRSIQETTGDPSIECDGGNTVTYTRVRSRECVRIKSGTLSFDHCYFEAQGVPGDHADVFQAFEPGTTGGSVTVKNTHIRAYNSDATAGFFVADDWTQGDVIFENVIFQGGPFGLDLHADVGGDINLYMKNVYFVGPFGNDPFHFLDFGGGQVVIHQWDNVRNATIVNGVLVPGTAIPQP